MDNARQQIVDSIKNSNNILVTVSNNPSVDELSAALGLTIVLNNLDKRATAIFSGAIPPAITFLEPSKTFANNADSLRDFIIALDKGKADHLRYKVDGDVVKIFITPYKTTLSQADLEFSQGDYNVDLILALGVKDQGHLDGALEAHGKILHDATVATITSGAEVSTLGGVDWHEATASSLSEMVVALADGLKGEGPILDEQIATSLLTGIVSATERFSNDHTTSRAMTMAAQLMAAGANQQLIAAKLEEANDIGPESTAKPADEPKENKKSDSPSELTINRASDQEKSKPADEKPVEEKLADEKPADESPTVPPPSKEEVDQQELEKQLAGITSPGGSLADIEKELKKAAEEQQAKDDTANVDTVPEPAPELPAAAIVEDTTVAPAEEPEVVAEPPTLPEPEPVVEPAVATPTTDSLFEPVVPPAPSEPIEEPKITTNHGDFSQPPVDAAPPINGVVSDPNEGEPPTVDPFSVPPNTPPSSAGTAEGAALLSADPLMQIPTPTVAAPSVEIPQLPPLPSMPTDVSLPPLPPPPPPPPILGQPPSGSPSGAVSGDVFGDGSDTAQPPTAPPEPGQFKIPGT